MASEKDLIAWKTDAWKDPGMAAWYNQRMNQNQGPNRLKNRVEVDLMSRYAIGPKILDVGAGTGRASLPLARAGHKVTAIDSSQAMLDQYRANAGELPVDLKIGDVTRLPCADGEFDTLVSLNVMVHFPHWQDILKEWKRVVRPGGRIVFDIRSLDHVEAVERIKPHAIANFVQQSFEGFTSKIKSDDILAVANALDLALVDIIPYYSVFDSGNPNLWLHGSLASKTHWERLLSWLAVDRRMFDFSLFFEQECLAYLSPMASPQMAVVLENREDKAGNAAWLERRRSLDRVLTQGMSLPALSTLIPRWDAAWRDRLNAHLDWPRNRVMAFFLWSAAWNHPGVFDLSSFLDTRHLGIFERWQEEWHADTLATFMLRMLLDEPNFHSLFTYRGIPLGNGFEYELTREMLTDYFEVFKA